MFFRDWEEGDIRSVIQDWPFKRVERKRECIQRRLKQGFQHGALPIAMLLGR